MQAAGPQLHTASAHSTEPLPTEDTACNLCGGNRRKLLYSENYHLQGQSARLDICRCDRCGLVAVGPRLTRDAVARVYACDAENTISQNYCWDQTASTSRFRPLLERIQKVVPRGRLLDVGCGAGDLLDEARKFGCWELEGLDPSAQAAELAQQRVGCTIHQALLEDVDLPSASFDVITLLGVLEHLHDPSSTLARVHELLKPGGVVAVYVPNFDYLKFKDAGLLCYLRRGRWSDLHPQEHQFQFTRRTLSHMLSSREFDLLRMDVGQPFLRGNAVARTFKKLAFAGAVTLSSTLGIHLGGLEAIGRKAA